MFSSAFPNDPTGYGANQRWHFGIGLAVTVAGLLVAPLSLAWIGAAVWAAYLVGVEIVAQRFALPADSIEDSGHVGLGAATVAMIYQHDLAWALVALAGHAGIVGFGMWRRW